MFGVQNMLGHLNTHRKWHGKWRAKRVSENDSKVRISKWTHYGLFAQWYVLDMGLAHFLRCCIPLPLCIAFPHPVPCALIRCSCCQVVIQECWKSSRRRQPVGEPVELCFEEFTRRNWWLLFEHWSGSNLGPSHKTLWESVSSGPEKIPVNLSLWFLWENCNILSCVWFWSDLFHHNFHHHY